MRCGPDHASISLSSALYVAFKDINIKENSTYMIKLTLDGRPLAGNQVAFGLIPLMEIHEDGFTMLYNDIHSPDHVTPFCMYSGEECLEKFKTHTSNIQNEITDITTNGIRIKETKINIKFELGGDLKSIWLLFFGKSCNSFSENECICPFCSSTKQDIHEFNKWRSQPSIIQGIDFIFYC